MRPRRPPALLDVLLALALSALTLAALLPDIPGDSAPAQALALTLALLAVAPIALRQRAPMLTLVVIAAALAGYGLIYDDSWPSGGLGLIVAIFTLATLRPPSRSLIAMPLVVVIVLISKLTDDEVTWPLALQGLLVCICAWAIGAGTRRWAQEAETAAARTERVLAEERIRIARELHDVVAHHMSVVALQTGVADYVLGSDPATARDAVAIAGSASREALQEMARLLDALRTDEAPAGELSPQPGLAQLDDLVARVRAVGIDVRLHRRGNPRALSTGLELCAFRVVQESLTNVLKHAGPGTQVDVTIEYADALLAVSVVDDGRGRPGRGRTPGAGRGIDGMRERAELYGGTLVAAHRPGGGFGVRLEVPAQRRPSPQHGRQTDRATP